MSKFPTHPSGIPDLNGEIIRLRSLVEKLELALGKAEMDNEAWRDLVAGSAPLAWVASHDLDSATKWEKKAADMLTKNTKLLSLEKKT